MNGAHRKPHPSCACSRTGLGPAKTRQIFEHIRCFSVSAANSPRRCCIVLVCVVRVVTGDTDTEQTQTLSLPPSLFWTPKMCQADARGRDISPDSSRLHRFIHLHIDIFQTHTIHSIYVSTCSFVRLLHTALTPSSPGAPEAYSSSVLSSTQCFATDTCVCVCVCLYAQAYACVHACVYVCMNARTYVRTHTCNRVIVCARACVRVCVRVCMLEAVFRLADLHICILVSARKRRVQNTSAASVRLTQRVRSNVVSAVHDCVMASAPGSARYLQPETLSASRPGFAVATAEIPVSVYLTLQ